MEVESGAVDIGNLVIASVCDHYTRHSHGGYVVQSDAPAIGLLFGTINGPVVSICDTTEAVYTFHDGSVDLNRSSIQKKIELWQGVFNQQQLVGWYTLGDNILPNHYRLHEEMMSFNDSLIFLLMNPTIDHDAKQLPLAVYVLDPADEQRVFDSRQFKLEAPHMENIAIDEVLKSTPAGDTSTTELKNQSMLASIKALAERIDVLLAALNAIQSGTAPRDEDLLRRAAAICQRLPPHGLTDNSIAKKNDEASEDTLALSLMSVLSSNLSALNELYGCYNTAFPSSFKPGTRFR